MEKEVTRSSGLTGFSLKLIAIVSMLIDHIAAVLLDGYVETSEMVAMVNLIMRSIGRLAFPLFAFLLVEGFFFTRSRKKYLIRLWIFALISEFPFDLAFHRQLLEFTYQNVFFTLGIGFAVIWGIEYARKKEGGAGIFLSALITLAGCLLALLLKTDYHAFGVLAVLALYLLHGRPIWAMAGACMILCGSNLLELFTFADLGLIFRYQGKRGRGMKWFFYFFYPLHLLILYGISIWLLG